MTKRPQPPVLADLYQEIAEAPEGEPRLPLLGQAIALAEEAGDEESLYELRCSLTEAANRADDAESEVAAFSWVLSKHLSDPERFPMTVYEPDYVDVAWMFKWVLNTLMKNSAIEREQIEASLSAMEDLYRRNGLGMSAPALYRLSAAESLGDVADLPALVDQVEATPEDAHSDCEACTPHWLAGAELMLGENARAFERAKRVLAEGTSCLSEPHEMLAELVLPLLIEGDTATAEDYFRRCLDKVWSGASERMTASGGLLAAAAVSGNIAFGLDLLERRLPDLAKVIHDHQSRVTFLTGGALLLERASQAGLGSRAVRDSAHVLTAQSIGSGTTVEELAPSFWAEATRLAAAFDARAGNRWWQGWVERRRALASVEVPLDLGFDEPEQFSAVPSTRPESAQEWLDFADERHWVGDHDGALRAVEKAFSLGELAGRQLVEALATRARQVAAAAQDRAGVTTLAELGAEDRAGFDEAYRAYLGELEAQQLTDRLKVVAALGAERYDQEWDPDPEELVAVLTKLRSEGTSEAELFLLEDRVANGLIERERGEEALPYIFAARDHCLLAADAKLAAQCHLSTARSLSLLGNPGAVGELEAVLDDSSGGRGLRAAALRLRAFLHAQAGEWAEGEQAAREAGHLFHALDSTSSAVDVLGLQAALAEEAGNLAGAISATRRALDLSERLESFDSAGLLTDLGRRLVRAGHAGQAVAVLSDLDRLLLERDEPEGSPASYDCAFWLGTAMEESDDPDHAAGVWQMALDLAISRGDDSATIAFGRALGGICARYSMWDDALEAFRAARDVTTDAGDRAQLSERVGLIRCFADDAGGLEDIDAAIEQAKTLDAPLAVADWTDSRARGLVALGRTDEAIAAGLASSDLFAAVGDRHGWAGGLELAARLLAHDGRSADAVALLDPIVAEGSEPEVVGLRQVRDELRDGLD